jgi:hypothetical protein
MQIKGTIRIEKHNYQVEGYTNERGEFYGDLRKNYLATYEGCSCACAETISIFYTGGMVTLETYISRPAWIGDTKSLARYHTYAHAAEIHPWLNHIAMELMA